MTLIMSEDRPQQIWDGEKTLTCRPRKEGDIFQHATDVLPAKVLDANMRTRWEVGKSYGIVPKRAHPVCLVDADGKVVKDLHDRLYTLSLYADDVYDLTLKQARDVLLEANIDYRLLQVKLLEIRELDVRDMTHEEALAEGFASARDYVDWWMGTYDPHSLELVQWFDAEDDEGNLEQRGISTPQGYVTTREAFMATLDQSKYEAWMLRFQAVKP